MCGRYTLSVPLSNLVDAFDVLPPEFDYLPRFNIAPTQDAPVVGQDGDGRRMGLLRWGLIPSWAKEPAIGSKMINARAETVAEKPAFKRAFHRRRCLVPADGFFEWQKEAGEGAAKGLKTPHWIHLPGGVPFAMAGLWEKWAPTDADPMHTFTIITTQAVPSIRDIHPRMPVILPPEDYAGWLDPDTSTDTLLSLLRPYEGVIQAYPVSTLVNSPGNDHPECIEPA